MPKIQSSVFRTALACACLLSVSFTGCFKGEEPPPEEAAPPKECIKIADPGLLKHAMRTWDSDHDECITKEEAEAVTNLGTVLSADEVSSLDDLSLFPNIKQISDMAFLVLQAQIHRSAFCDIGWRQCICQMRLPHIHQPSQCRHHWQRCLQELRFAFDS